MESVESVWSLCTRVKQPTLRVTVNQVALLIKQVERITNEKAQSYD